MRDCYSFIEIEKLTKALDKGKIRGYFEYINIDDITYLFQYAIKKLNEKYLVYIFSIDESKMVIYEEPQPR
ncbi:hypothetical protein [Xenorhabdus entomophaga]|uniref:hypothetical protein n=1 Tax=Xenorhabdus entomophaga TaxID=3136257 RepID=UPI0030F48252